MTMAIIILATIMCAAGAILPFIRPDESCEPDNNNTNDEEIGR